MKNIIYLISISFLLFSCEEVIDIDLNESQPQWVIEGRLTDQAGPVEVRISQSGSYFEPGNYPLFEGARVSISSSSGQSWNLSEKAAGLYVTDPMKGIGGETYRLEVDLDGQKYEAISTLTQAIQLDTVLYEYRSSAIGLGEGYMLRVRFQDPPGVPTYLRFIVKANGETVDQYFLYDDNLSDGQQVEFPLFGSFYEAGTDIEISIMSLDEANYIYFSSLGQILGLIVQPAAATPSNPPSNFTPDVLGYFGAYGVSDYQLRIE